MKKIITVLSVLLILTGCTNTQYKMKVFDGGASSLVIDHSIDKDLLEELSELDLEVVPQEDLTEEIATVNFLLQETSLALYKAGFDITSFEEERKFPISKDEVKEGEEAVQPTYIASGFKAVRHFESAKDLNETLEKLNKLNLVTINGQLDYKSGIITKNYRFMGTLKLFDQAEKIKDYEDVDNIGDYQDMIRGFHTSFEIELPGRIKNTTSTEETGSVWVASYDNPEVEVKVLSEDLNKKFIWATLAIVVVAVPFSLIKLRKKQKGEYSNE